MTGAGRSGSSATTSASSAASSASVADNVAASGVELSAETLEAIDSALGDVIVRGAHLAAFANAGVKHR